MESHEVTNRPCIGGEWQIGGHPGVDPVGLSEAWGESAANASSPTPRFSLRWQDPVSTSDRLVFSKQDFQELATSPFKPSAQPHRGSAETGGGLIHASPAHLPFLDRILLAGVGRLAAQHGSPSGTDQPAEKSRTGARAEGERLRLLAGPRRRRKGQENHQVTWAAFPASRALRRRSRGPTLCLLISTGRKWQRCVKECF